jgi:hypothetical protein
MPRVPLALHFLEIIILHIAAIVQLILYVFLGGSAEYQFYSAHWWIKALGKELHPIKIHGQFQFIWC